LLDTTWGILPSDEALNPYFLRKNIM
jgi:hypothetical protein